MGMTIKGRSYWQAETDSGPLFEMTIGDLLDRRAGELPTQEAIVYSCYPEFGDSLNIRWTYQEYRERANTVARGLIALGLKHGDHIAIWAINLPEYPLIQMAAAKVGLVLVTVNPLLKAAEVEYILKQGDIRALFCMASIRDHDCLSTIRSMTTPGSQHGEVSSDHLPMLRYISLLGAPPDSSQEQEGWRPTFFGEMVAAGSQVSDAELHERQAAVTLADPALIMYTSGTTGFPKGAVLTHRGILNDAAFFIDRWRVNQNTRFCAPVPFFHVFGAIGYILTALYTGGTLHPMLTFDAVKALQIISRERCSFSGGVPTMLIAMLQHPDFGSYDIRSLKQVMCGGAPVPVSLMEQVKARMGADISILFGQTESSGAITATLPDDSFDLKSATVGTPLPYTEIKIMDPVTREIVPCGKCGEICCRGVLVMAGYHSMPEKTSETIDEEEWLHTGDLATMNHQGYINIVGRLKDMIIRGGENLYPAEIEAFLMHHPKVADTQVVGVPDAFMGEEAVAILRLVPGESADEAEIRNYCQANISKYKIPKYIRYVTDYPMTASGKVKKFELRAQLIQELGLQEVARTKTA